MTPNQAEMSRLQNYGQVCEYCQHSGTLRRYDVISHGRFVCINHIEASETDFIRDNPI